MCGAFSCPRTRRPPRCEPKSPPQKSRFADPPAPRGSALWQQWDAALGADHPARLVDDFVDRLDQTALNQCYAGVGSLAYRPDLMLKMVLYETLEGRLSPAQWARDLPINDALRWLGQGIRPSRSALTTFGIGWTPPSSRSTPRRSDRRWPKGSPPPNTGCSTARRFGPAPRGTTWPTRKNSASDGRN